MEGRTKRRINPDENVFWQESIEKNERTIFLPSEVKFHSIEKREIDEGLFFKIKGNNKKCSFNFKEAKQLCLNNTTYETLLAIFHFNISTPLSHTHIRTCSSVTSLLHCTPISPIRRKHVHIQPNNFHRASRHLIFKPRNREYHLSISSSKREWRL